MKQKSGELQEHSPKILIIGGTTEGRIAVKVCDESGNPYFYSTKSDLQQIECAHGTRVTGGLDERTMPDFCRQNDIGLIIDAAHPFAMGVHRNIGNAAEVCGIPVVRIERHFPEQDPRFLWFDTYQDTITYLESHDINRVLALTGVNTIKPLKAYWLKHETYFRIMKRQESIDIAEHEEFPIDHILFYEDEKDDEALYKRLRPEAIITKESGESGGFGDKTQKALDLDIPVLVVRRPALPYTPASVVYGHLGLRRAVEQLLPNFFPLKTGYTTGTCATASTSAALRILLTGEAIDACTISLPNGEPITIPIEQVGLSTDNTSATATVRKYSGDDPDVTNGTEICSQVSLNESHSEIKFLQGIGVGVVTLPGLGLEIGGPAINNTPRMMMKREVERILTLYGDDPSVGVDIIISVPKGEELAKLTFNPKIGVLGGISIIGTSGIVRPFSSEAFVNSIKAEIRVAKSMGVDRLVINSGAKSQKYLKALYPDLPSQAFVHYGNFIGDTISAAADQGFTAVTMGVMIGKAVKLAEGLLDTHSKKAVMNKDFINSLAHQTGYDSEIIRAIDAITLARELWDIIPPTEKGASGLSPFYQLLIEKCHNTCDPLIPDGRLTIYLITESGELLI